MTNIINKVIKNGTEYQIYASGGAAIAVDSELSTTSTNPAQNKVITTAINSKAADNAVVKLTGNQTVAGTKTFSTSPVVPSKNSAASSSNKTVIATEAQVALKQDALTLPSSPTSGHIVTWGANNKTLADGGSIPTVNNSTITFTQGGVSKGTITTNQSSASTIALDAGGNYDNITKSEIQTGTATTQRTISASVITSALPRISSLPNNILTSGEIWAGNLSDYKAMGDGRPSTTLFFCIDDGWKPGANTLAYFPFESDTLDHSGNGVTLTNTSYLSQQTIGYSWVASQGVGTNYVEMGFTNQDAKFISMWVKVNSSSGNTVLGQLDRFGDVGYAPSHYDDTNLNNKFYIFTNSSYSVGATSNGLTFNEWHHITIGYDGSKVVISKDGVQETLYNGSGYNFGNQVWLCGIGSRGNANYTLSECIVENKARTAQEISDYYNKTKSKYGL